MEKYTVLSPLVDSKDNYKHYGPGDTIYLDDERAEKLLVYEKIGPWQENPEPSADPKPDKTDVDSKAEPATDEPDADPEIAKEDKTSTVTKEDKTSTITKAPSKAKASAAKNT